MSANDKKYKLPEYLDLKQFLKDHKDKLNAQIVESINSVLKTHDNFFGKLTDSEVSYLLKYNSTFKSNSDKIKNQITKVKAEAESCKNKVESILSNSGKNKEQLDKAVAALEAKQELDDDLNDINYKINNASSQTEKDELEKIKANIELKIAKNNRALVGFDINQLQNYASISKQAKQTTEETIDMEEELAENMNSTNEALENRAKGINAINTALKDMGGVLMGYVKDGFEKWKEIDEKVYTVGRNIGLSSKELRGYQINVMNNYDEMASKLGMTFDELFKFQENYTKSTGRAIVLTNNQVESLGAVSKLVGDVATNEMVKNMDDFGASTQTATSYLAVNMARARSQGLDAQKASEAFANNVKLASKYTFREGINGISKMTLLSQKLKFNMDSIANAAEKFETVEGAIGTAANLQMLGGTYSAQFGNPLEAMNMAMLDMEGFTNKIVDTFGSKATFNRETGQVEMSAIDKRLMKEAAKQLGISYEEAWNMASQQAKISDIERDLSKNTQGFTEDEKAFISSKTQFIDGKHQMVFYDEEGNEQQIEIGNLTREQLNIIRSQKDVEHAIQGDVHGIHSLLHEYVKGETLDKMSWNEARKGINESIAINFADMHDEYMSPVKNLHKDVINEDNRWVLASILGVLGAGVSAIPTIMSKMMPNIGDTIGKKIFDTFSGWGRGSSTGGTPHTGSTSSSGWGRRIKNGAKSVWGGVKKYGGKALRGIGRVASKLPGWGKVIGIGAALLGGMSLMSAADGSQVDKSKLGGREVEPINNENENTTSSVNQQSQELIELQKHTALLQAIVNKQGIDVKTIHENSTFNKTDIEDNSEQTTASSVLSDSMNTTLMASQVGSSKIAAKGLKAVAGRSGLKMAANMGKMAKASNPLGWISLGSSVLKDVSGVEEGSGVDKAWSTANAALDGAALGGMIGSVIPGLGTAVGTAVGAAVGGVVGIIDNYGEDIAKATKSVVDGVSGFLFGEDNMTEADKMQQSYEETKLGVVDISDPQLEQKAYVATCKIHDVVISMWHHMNGKQSNGLKEDKGLFGGMSNSVNNVTNNVGNALLNTVSAPFKLIGSLFSGNEEKIENKNVINNNAYANENPYNTQNYKNSDLTNTNEVNYRNNSYLSEVSVKDIYYNNDNVTPKVSVGLPTSIKETSVNNYNNSSYNNIGSNKLDLNVSGTIKLTSDRGRNVDIDFNKLLDTPEFMNSLINLISQDFNKRVNGQRENKNSVISLQNGGYNYNIFNATTNGWA